MRHLGRSAEIAGPSWQEKALRLGIVGDPLGGVHVAGDEYYPIRNVDPNDLNRVVSPYCRCDGCRDLSPGELLMAYLIHVGKTLAAEGLSMVHWQDNLVREGALDAYLDRVEAEGLLTPVIAWWKYNDPVPTPDALRPETWVCPTTGLFSLEPSAVSKVTQGVTTEVVGNCGFSPFPVSPRRRRLLEEFVRGLGTPHVDADWCDFDGYAQALQSVSPVMHVAPLVGHGALRTAAAGNADVPAGPALLAEMTAALRVNLEPGAFGLSTGLTYVPSKFATVEEICALAAVVRDHDALYATHSRVNAEPFATFDEPIEVGRRTRVRVQFSHVALNDPATWGEPERSSSGSPSRATPASTSDMTSTRTPRRLRR